MVRRVAIVPHTHWDREWYAPFQTYRLRLVKLLDEFLPFLEGDPSYRHFLLDGQTAVVDDYLEIRPEALERLKRLAGEGRIAMGPWMILMDEFMVSGETIVRNLQTGITRATSLGGAMPVGYLPDMFGHAAQMPQILRLAGCEHAIVWRGVPGAIDASAFWWEGPDGSRVRAEYLYGSYSNGRDIQMDPARLIERARDYEHELGEARVGDLLLMNGTDHQVPQTWLGTVVEQANATQDEYSFEVIALAEYLERQPVDGLATWRGELRSGARSNLLMGVVSNRRDVKLAAAAAEQALERRAEPLCALLARDRYPSTLLDLAWRSLVLNSAHDSSCACSIDEVVDEVIVRYREARQIAEGLADEAAQGLAATVDAPPGSILVINQASHARAQLVETRVPGIGPIHFLDPDGTPRPAQVRDEPAREVFTAMVMGSKIRWVLDMMRGQEFAGRHVRSARVEEMNGGDASSGVSGARAGMEPGPRYDVLIEAAAPAEPAIDVTPMAEQLLALSASADATFRFRLLAPAERVATFSTGTIEGYGWSCYTPVEGTAPHASPDAADPEVITATNTMDNQLLRVTVDPTDGTVCVETHSGMRLEGCNRYIDGGDGGDTYNYSPPTTDLLIDRPVSVKIECIDAGPLRARLLVTTTYDWPLHAEGNERSCSARSAETAPVSIGTTLELRTGEPFLRVHVELDNPCRDHRLRVHLPLPAPVRTSHAECAFAVVERGLEVEGGPHEYPLPTFPSRRFVDCSDGSHGLAVVHDGLMEYEVVDQGRTLALTLLRATGYLSRIEPAFRPNPAGPALAVEGAQMLGRNVADYALFLHEGDWHEAGIPTLADQALLPFEVATVTSTTTGTRPMHGQFLNIQGAEVTALYRDSVNRGALIARLVNLSPEHATARLESNGMGIKGDVIDLLGQVRGTFDTTLPLTPWQLATLRFIPTHSPPFSKTHAPNGVT